jgi:hypothetical protein
MSRQQKPAVGIIDAARTGRRVQPLDRAQAKLTGAAKPPLRIVFAGRYAKVREANGGTIVTGSLECHAQQCGRKYIPRDRA